MTNPETIGERENLQHLKQSSFREPNFVLLLDQVNLTKDFNGTLGNLGGYGESLEEGGLLWTKPSVLRRNKYINGC